MQNGITCLDPLFDFTLVKQTAIQDNLLLLVARCFAHGNDDALIGFVAEGDKVKRAFHLDDIRQRNINFAQERLVMDSIVS